MTSSQWQAGWECLRLNTQTDECMHGQKNNAASGPFVHYRQQGPDLHNILRQSYDNAKVTIHLRRTSNLQNILRRTTGFS